VHPGGGGPSLALIDRIIRPEVPMVTPKSNLKITINTSRKKPGAEVECENLLGKVRKYLQKLEISFQAFRSLARGGIQDKKGKDCAYSPFPAPDPHLTHILD